jgi:hypothetical protein
MENIFNFKRFWLLVRKHANENWKINTFFFIAMSTQAIFMYFITHNPNQDQVIWNYIFYLEVFGLLYTSTFFKQWTYKARATSLLVLPATAFEKIALVFFFTVVLLIPVFTVVSYCSNFVFSKIFNPEISFSYFEQYKGKAPYLAVIIYALIPYIFFQSLILLFSVWFKTKQILISIVVIALLFILVYIWNSHFIQGLTGANRVVVLNQIVFFPTDIDYNHAGSNHKISSKFITHVSILILVISSLLFYIASYFKLKEKEI